jgi:SH3-like domain-containing protein
MAKLKMLLVMCLVISLAEVATFAEEQKGMSVLVKEGHLRSAPSFLGKIVTTVAYTKQVEILEKKDAWIKVRTLENGVEGWLHSSALTKKEVVLKAGEKDVDQIASSAELALAGKMFNKDVEDKFKEQNASVNYAAVDKMEKNVVSQKKLVAFFEQGELSPEGGSK